MNSPYRTPGAMFYVPRRKNELIDMIVKAGWAGTKTALRQMEHRQLKAILIGQRNKHFNKSMMRNPVHLSNGQASKNIPQTHTQTNEVKHDRTNNAVGGIERADGSR